MTEFEKREREDFENVFFTQEGSRFIGRLIDACGVYQSSYFPKENAADTAFREGRRDIGLMILRWVQEIRGGEQMLLDAQAVRRERYESDLRETEGSEWNG
jgi:hypothetical protein